ncbi:1248_t:CDS:2 [Racocetra fulgida]|uniref:1248_t:CDS:1 n=1 Tax=Racocetra fulgida TaxID=60492 RepID=A0A9N8VT50_9GLOM|nr:1248_t:CDS:2 [Racocetra fulgida]
MAIAVYSKQIPIREALLIPLDIKKHDKENNKYIVNSYWQAFNYNADANHSQEHQIRNRIFL